MDSQLLWSVGIVLFDVSRYILTGSSVCESVWKYAGEKMEKIILTVKIQSCFRCMSPHQLQYMAAKWDFVANVPYISMGQPILGRTTLFLAILSFLKLVHDCTHSLAHSWFLIAFTWQWVSAWTRQAWRGSLWVTTNFCSHGEL